MKKITTLATLFWLCLPCASHALFEQLTRIPRIVQSSVVRTMSTLSPKGRTLYEQRLKQLRSNLDRENRKGSSGWLTSSTLSSSDLELLKSIEESIGTLNKSFLEQKIFEIEMKLHNDNDVKANMRQVDDRNNLLLNKLFDLNESDLKNIR